MVWTPPPTFQLGGGALNILEVFAEGGGVQNFYFGGSVWSYCWGGGGNFARREGGASRNFEVKNKIA